jgi:hypothetical protein
MMVDPKSRIFSQARLVSLDRKYDPTGAWETTLGFTATLGAHLPTPESACPSWTGFHLVKEQAQERTSRMFGGRIGDVLTNQLQHIDNIEAVATPTGFEPVFRP